MTVVKAAAVQLSPVLSRSFCPGCRDQAVTVGSAATQAIADAAREAEIVVSIGVNERDGGSAVGRIGQLASPYTHERDGHHEPVGIEEVDHVRI